MLKYIVTMTMLPEDLLAFLSSGVGISVETELIIKPTNFESFDSTADTGNPPAEASPPKQRNRTSKIETVIRTALADEPRGTPYLKSEMERAGLKPNSLGATLSRMRKNGEVDNRNGVWSLSKLALADVWSLSKPALAAR
jgi:hypothetical protein